MTAQQLKNSILQMAVQGKLVPQDPNDEPASVLIQKIRDEKEQLINDGTIKKEKNPSFIFRGDDGLFYEKVGNKEPVCIEDEVPFEIPDSWEWVRLSTICTKLVDGDHNPPKGETKETAYIMASSTNINNDTLVELTNVRYLSESVFNKENERTDVKKGDIFFTSVGSLGRSCVYTGGKHICFQRSVSVITTLIYNYYLKYYFDSDYIQHKIVTEATGTAQKGFYLNQLGELLISVPPIREQHRIVEKTRKILPYIDDCNKKERRLSLLNETFPEQLKKSILQGAVQGELVSQNPDDEPASVLINRIHDEKEQLIKDGKIKRDKHESVIYRRDGSYYEKVDEKERCINDEIPYEIPDSWEWVRFNNLVYYIIGKTPPRKETEYWEPPKYSWVSIADMNADGTVTTTKEQVSQLAFDYTFKGNLSPAETLLMSFKLTVGKVSILKIPAFHNEAIISIYPIVDEDNTLRDYLFYTMPLLSQLGETKSAIKGNTLNSKSLDALLVPVPPLNEQKRIVTRLNQVMGLCDELL